LRGIWDMPQSRYKAGYEEQKITGVVQWMATVESERTPPTGTEKRRVKALQAKYEKKLFVDAEKEVLSEIQAAWAASEDDVKKEAAAEFAKMLEDEYADLPYEQEGVCKEAAHAWEEQYLRGVKRLSIVAGDLVGLIVDKEMKLDHPVINNLTRLLRERHKPARDNLKKAVFRLRYRKYTLLFLKDLIAKDRINPVMAVETKRLTKDEHEQLLRRQNHRRRVAIIDVIGDIVADYCETPFDVRRVPAASEEARLSEAEIQKRESDFVHECTIGALEEQRKDDEIGEMVREELPQLRSLWQNRNK
jgi:hypothetical protein